MYKLPNYMNWESLKIFKKLLLHGLKSLKSKMDNMETGLKVRVGEQHVSYLFQNTPCFCLAGLTKVERFIRYNR
jgi:hypothetical protein